MTKRTKWLLGLGVLVLVAANLILLFPGIIQLWYYSTGICSYHLGMLQEIGVLGASDDGPDIISHYESSLKALDKYIERNPKNSTVWKYRGSVLYALAPCGPTDKRQDRYEEAVKSFDKALELDPKGAEDILSEKAYALHTLKRYDQAIKCYDKVLKLRPKESLYWSSLGECLIETGQYQEALQAFDQAIEICPGYNWYWSLRAKAYSYLKDRSNALKDLAHSLDMETNPDYKKSAKLSAKRNKAFQWLWEDEEFKQLVEEKK